MNGRPTATAAGKIDVVDRCAEPRPDLCDQKILVFLPWAATEENVASASIELTAERIRAMTLAVRPPAG